jgi:AraC family transcriptional regulator of adaptative response/methylated-DNA-[protein]-cysteine methyltransferase
MASIPENEIMYQAFKNKDSNFEVIFFVGVKTTDIFCRPTCTAKNPNKENVVFFSPIREALLEGYRPCKICRPQVFQGEYPE